MEVYIINADRIWVILLKTGQNCDIEGKNSKCEFLMLLFEMKAWHLLCTQI